MYLLNYLNKIKKFNHIYIYIYKRKEIRIIYISAIVYEINEILRCSD